MVDLRSGVVFLLALVATAQAQDAPTLLQPAFTPEQADFFERRVRPVLATHCLGCHGATRPRAGLRLDSRAAVLSGSESGTVVTPGAPDDSPLIEAVRRDGPVKMPPKEALDPAAVADLESWVRMGVPWAEETVSSATHVPGPRPAPLRARCEKRPALEQFQPVRNPASPMVKRQAWARTSVDPFILAMLEARGLDPSPEADRRTLIRRVTFDLTGLPPTPEQVEAFIGERETDAYDRLVDRLLASPSHGERWGRYWLDVARYADTKGYVFFEDASFPWAFTYRDYVVRALNDDLPYDQFLVDQIAADRMPLVPGKGRGRVRAALGFLSLGGRFMNNPHDVIDDRIDVVTRGLMGLTVACARCHDHKFDPIPSTDYYALYGVFASTAQVPGYLPCSKIRPDTPEYRAFADRARGSARGESRAEFLAAKRAELVASARSRVAEYLLAAEAARDQPTTEEFMLIADSGDLNPAMIVRWRAYLERSRRGPHPIFSPWHALARLPEADFVGRAADYCSRLVSAPEPTRPVNGRLVEALAASPPRSLADLARIYATVLHAAEALGPDSAHTAAERALRDVLYGPDAPPNVDMNTLSALDLIPDRPSQATLKELQKAVETWRSTGPGAPPRAMVLVDVATPVEPRVFLRGNPNNPGPIVGRRFLSALSGPDPASFTDGSGRLELAHAIASADNPLTARVLVNRVWMHHVGTPLVSTPSDFGLRSDPPTNPGLLDHLAWTFMHEDAWSLKALHRRIVLSAAYRQSSDDRPEARALDPENTHCWRMNRRRLDFESLRDAALTVSGRLDGAIGGPPVGDIAAPPTAPVRRTLYGRIDRLNLPDLYRTFDFPDPNATSPMRDETTVSPQALFLMNHPFARTAARALNQRPDVAGLPDPAAKVHRLYHLLLGRDPSAQEEDLALRFVSDPEGGWDRYAQVLLLSNEFAFID